jgi:hypothetical protein
MLIYRRQRDARGWEPCAILLGLLLLSWTPRRADATEPGNVEHGMDYTAIIVLPVMEPRGRAPVAMLRIWSRWDVSPRITPIYGT